MKFNRKILFGLTLTLLLSAGLVYAASSSDYLAKAQSYIDDNCNKPYLSEKTSLDCYLFHKVNEPGFGSAALKTFDANGNELGIYVDSSIERSTFFYTPLNKLVRVIDEMPASQYNGRLFNMSGGLFYTQLNCAGAPYLWPGASSSKTYLESFLIPEWNGKYYTFDASSTPTNRILLSSYNGVNNCDSTAVNQADVYPITEVSVPLPNPVSLPLQFKYQ